MEIYNEFIHLVKDSYSKQKFVKLTLSKPSKKESGIKNIYVRLLTIKNQPRFSFTYRYTTNDQVKNFDLEEAIEELNTHLKESFRIATLLTTQGDSVLTISKKGKASIQKLKASFSQVLPENHDRDKQKRTEESDAYLNFLGVTDKEGNVIPKMADKYRQINKYLEIIEGLIKSVTLPDEINIVDMGSGKGYLTFALYDYLHNKRRLNVKMTGIELRNDLVDYCNQVAGQCGFENLKFVCKPIEDFKEKRIDVLIALHACDTATDDAIGKGISAEASLIICAPCCHKQIRRQLKGKEQESPILKYGIFKERQCEMITDTIRALIMEKKQYQTNIFEFVSNEHTRKNILLVGSKSSAKVDEKMINDKISAIKSEYGIEYHYLEKIIS